MSKTRKKIGPKTKVLFRMFQGEVLALFPEEAGDMNPDTCSCYAHVGQHSAAHVFGVMRKTRPAKPKEFAPLKEELERIGYQLKIGHKTTRVDFEKRRRQLL